jgi:8-oxo-dGTP pyrophosphatase MutT (NUDIX family)
MEMSARRYAQDVMAHIHTGPGQHDLTVSAFIVRDAPGGPCLLLHRHKKLALLLQPGGHVELDENPWAAIIREIAEETGYRSTQLAILQPPQRMVGPLGDSAVLHPQPVSVLTHDYDPDGRHRHTDLGFAFLASEEPDSEPQAGESACLLWVSLAELALLTDIPENTRQIGQFVLEAAREQWQPVPTTVFNT